MKLSDFDYTLPKELIAQEPVRQREKCRLMVLDRKTHKIYHKYFEDIVEYFNNGDLLVLNNTKVIPARLFGKRRTGGKVEIFLLEKKNPVCEALVRPSWRLKEGEMVTLESGDEVEILNRGETGRFVKLSRPIEDILKGEGHVPLPPYIRRPDRGRDRQDYQTVYASKEGATASPTAGLHFTEKLLERVTGLGVRVTHVTLHTSYGTFAPIKTEDAERHKMHKEYFELPQETAKAVAETKRDDGKVFAVGTTTTRTLEYCAQMGLLRRPSTFGGGTPRNDNERYSGFTDLFIYPGYEFKVVDHLITNFHLPKSTLLLLVSAFAGREFVFEAYRKAIESRYRFYSYGDAKFLI